MTTLDDTTDENGTFTGDRYERLQKSVEMLADDENLVDAEPPYNAEGLIAFAGSIAQLRLLDGLSDYDANTVSLIVVLDFLQGPRRMAWRLWDMLGDEPRTPLRLHRRRDRGAGMNVINIVGAPRACCICLESLAEWPIGAHNADPVAPADCCDTCNDTFVIPAREAHS